MRASLFVSYMHIAVRVVQCDILKMLVLVTIWNSPFQHMCYHMWILIILMGIHMKGNLIWFCCCYQGSFLWNKIPFFFENFNWYFWLCFAQILIMVYFHFLLLLTCISHNVIISFKIVQFAYQHSNSVQLFSKIMVGQHLSAEIKAKIISMRQFSSLTWSEIAAQCGCNVSYIL